MGKRGHWETDECPHCGQAITEEWKAKRRAARAENVRQGLLKSKAEGNAIGRPRKRDDRLIRALRAKGLSIRVIAQKTGTSVGSVQASLTEK